MEAKKITKMIPMRKADIIRTTPTLAISKAIKGCPLISDNNESTKKTPFFSNLMMLLPFFKWIFRKHTTNECNRKDRI